MGDAAGPRCGGCGLGPHRYSTADPYHAYDAMGCVNMLRSELERRSAERDALKAENERLWKRHLKHFETQAEFAGEHDPRCRLLPENLALIDRNETLLAERDRLRSALEAATRHLKALCEENYEERYEDKKPCTCCFQAVYDAEAALTPSPEGEEG